MNVEIGTETPIFLFWEYLFRNFGILSVSAVETNLCCVSVVGDGAVHEALLLVVGELDVAQPFISVVVHISNNRKRNKKMISKNIKWD
jgi:hypothetical protein